MSHKQLLIGAYKAALSAVDPLQIIPNHLSIKDWLPENGGRTIVVGAGKAAASMAKAVEDMWPADASIEGLVITRYKHGYEGDAALKRIRVIEAGHPVPDESGEKAALEILQLVQSAGPDDVVIGLVSGGGSSLLSLPVAGVPMSELKAITKALLASGAPIQEMNVVRKHLSQIQGGQLAAACIASVLALVVSDVTGDEPTHIASGPFSPDPSTYQDALDILKRYDITAPAGARAHLERGAKGEIAETPKPSSDVFKRVECKVIATAQQSLKAAMGYFQQRGITPLVLGDTITGEAAEVAKVHAAIARQVRTQHHPFLPPVAIISGGECTVTIKGDGRGGRCSEFLLSLAVDLEGLHDVWAIAADTDGIDGVEENAGAVCGPDTLQRAAALGLKPKVMLANNDGFSFFEALHDLVRTGPTRTNVNDFRVVLIAS
jgi:glycerate 2-kinase